MANAVPAATKPPGFFRRLWRAARQVFHETTGALFFVLALGWTSGALRYWKQQAHGWEWKVSMGMALVMIFFGLACFRAARRVS